MSKDSRSEERKSGRESKDSKASASSEADHHNRRHHKDHRSSKDRHHHQHHKHSDHDHEHKKQKIERQPSALKMDVKLEPLNHTDILGDLNSSLSGGYDDGVLRSLPSSSQHLLPAKVEPVYDPNLGFTSRKARTLVYAGHSRAAHYDHVPRLVDLCLNLLSDNVDRITCLGDAPYFLMKTVLAKCTPNQLRRIEKYNEDLIEDTDELWQIHAELEFKGSMHKDEDETYREFYHRAVAERDHRLAKLTKKIQKKTVKDSAPVKKTLVVDTVPTKGRKLPANTKSAAQATAVSAADIKKNAKDVRVSVAAKAKHRTGPLMAKTMQMFKQRFRR